MDNKIKLNDILNFLDSKSKKDVEVSTIETIVEFLNSDIAKDICDIVAESIEVDVDFHSYFTNMDGIRNLISLKETDKDSYYKIIHYESVLINIVVIATECPYIIVLTPDNLYNSFYLQLRFK